MSPQIPVYYRFILFFQILREILRRFNREELYAASVVNKNFEKECRKILHREIKKRFETPSSIQGYLKVMKVRGKCHQRQKLQLRDNPFRTKTISSYLDFVAIFGFQIQQFHFSWTNKIFHNDNLNYILSQLPNVVEISMNFSEDIELNDLRFRIHLPKVEKLTWDVNWDFW